MITIGRRIVGPGAPCFVIAEAGVNHNGSEALALALVDAAHAAGADCVKFQTFTAERVASVRAGKAPYQRVTTGAGGDQIAMLRRLELPRTAYPRIMARCAALGIEFLSTPYSPEDADFLDASGAPAFKVASAQIVEKDFLTHLARTGRPIILSTGMATLDEVAAAVDWIRSAGSRDLVLLQCTTDYPARVDEANVRVVPMLRETFDVVAGYSDHTEGTTCCVAAVALGASVIEKHLTLDRGMEGPDHRASADPAQFQSLVSAIRDAEQALGSGKREPTARERANLPFMRRSLVAAADLSAGTVMTRDLVVVRRPADGISPSDIERVVGRSTRVSIGAGDALQWDFFRE